MKEMRKTAIVTAFAWAVMTLLGAYAVAAQDTPWLEPWSARHEVSVPNPCGEELYDYQVQIVLDASFDFAGAQPGGSDLMVTDNGGQDCIPFWVETWDPGANYASIWVKVPTIPVAGATIYLYYGNPSPPGPPPGELMEVGPIGPWDKQTTNIIPDGGPATGSSLLAENMVYDDVTGHYWMVFANYNNGSVGLAYTDTPDDPASWTWYGTVVSSANAPHILHYDGLWYIFYADQTYSMPGRPISVSTSTDIGGPYTKVTPPILVPSETWETGRVDEPYVFQRNDGKWILIYMGDAGGTTEQVGYAEADNILGPYTKFAGNPCIPFGPPGSIDAGTVADPWVVELDDVYYIGYTVSSSKSSPWRTALVTTTDWMTFTKHGVILDLGGAGDWDQYDAFRGAVTRFGDTYYFPYTGKRSSGGYLMGMATMSAFQMVYPPVCNDPEAVFEFIDTFEGDALNLAKWSPATGGTYDVSGGVLTLTATPSSYIQMRATTAVGTGTLMEADASHLDAGLNPGATQGNAAAELGYKRADLSFGTEVIRILDWPDLTYYCVQLAGGGAASLDGELVTSVPFDADWHTYRINRTTGGTVEFQIDNNPYEAFGPTYVPTSELYPWLMSYSRNTAPQSRFLVDWIRVRRFCGTEVSAAVGAVQYPVSTVSGHVYNAGTGVYGVPITLLDHNGDPYASGVTDNTGYYEFPDIPWGDYTVNISPPLGFRPDAEVQDITVAGVPVEVDFTLEPITLGKLHDVWWWMVYLDDLRHDGPRPDEFTEDEINEWGQMIFDHFYSRPDQFATEIEGVTFVGNPARALMFDDVCFTMLDDDHSTYESMVRYNLLANLLNLASGRLLQSSIATQDGATVSQAITYFAQIYDENAGWVFPEFDKRNKLIKAYLSLRAMTMGQLLPAGVVPLSIPNIMYKAGDQIGPDQLPSGFALTQNYPNPFNPTTTFDFALPSASQVKIDIYNVAGQHVATLVDKFLPAGYYTASWDASAAATGIYLYRLQAGNYSETRKMLLLK